MKIYITKYALTHGILTGSDAIVDGISASVRGVLYNSKGQAILDRGSCGTYQWFHGQDWHRTRTDAIARAEDMKQKKIRSLEKNLRKIQELVFK